jgi:hypothetical protein
MVAVLTSNAAMVCDARCAEDSFAHLYLYKFIMASVLSHMSAEEVLAEILADRKFTPGIFAREIVHFKCDKFFLNRAIILGAW